MSMVIEDYQHLSRLTGQMLEAARSGDWDTLVALEQECARHINAIKPRDNVPADEAARQQKADLIRKILADDKAIRERTTPWMAQLQGIMQSSRSEQRLQQAYHP